MYHLFSRQKFQSDIQKRTFQEIASERSISTYCSIVPVVDTIRRNQFIVSVLFFVNGEVAEYSKEC